MFHYCCRPRAGNKLLIEYQTIGYVLVVLHSSSILLLWAFRLAHIVFRAFLILPPPLLSSKLQTESATGGIFYCLFLTFHILCVSTTAIKSCLWSAREAGTETYTPTSSPRARSVNVLDTLIHTQGCDHLFIHVGVD